MNKGCRRGFSGGIAPPERVASVGFEEVTTDRPYLADGSRARAYMKADKFIIAYNHAGTLKYRYLDLTDTSGTWTYTTTAP